MTGKLLAGFIVITAILMGAGLYYTQVYAFYEKVAATAPAAEVRLTSVSTGQAELIPATDFEGIDADTSPLKFRACFRLPTDTATLTETYVLNEEARPLRAPNWFGCFNVNEITKAIEAGEALVFLGEENIKYGIDRFVAVMADGRAFAWNQINHCGEVVFEGKPAPESCPPVPQSN